MDYGLSENDLNLDASDSLQSEGLPDNSSANNDAIGDNGSKTQSAQIFKYSANGREIEEPIDVILKRASQGFNYAQHMEDFKRQQAEFENSRQMIETQAQKWRQYDEFANQNPQWAEHVRQQWENRNNFNSNSEQTSENSTIPPEVSTRLNELENFYKEYKTEREHLRREKEDIALNEQISSVRKEYPDIDFSYTDPESGKSLEWQVLEHAQSNGISNFKSAFRDLYHEKLLSRAVTKAKEEAAKELQARQQKGFIASSETPMLKPNSGRSTKSMSYYDLVLEGGKEHGII